VSSPHCPLSWFAEIGLTDSASVGGKGASLGELQRAGIRVPPGFVVTASAFYRFIDALDRAEPFRPRLASLSPADQTTIERVCQEVRDRIESTPLPPDVQVAITDAYRTLDSGGFTGATRNSSDLSVAVRSSATNGRSSVSNAYLAETHATYLSVRGAECVAHAVRSCWASLYDVRSVVHRLCRGLSEATVAMGVVVQRMVNSQCSGVMVTRCRSTGDHSLITIDGSWGLGSSIVSREVVPDRFVVSKITGEIVKRTLSDKRVQHLPDQFAGGVRQEAVPEAHRKIPCLTDAQIAELAQLAKRVERRYGSTQDIDWAIDHDEREPFLLETRTETGLPLVAPVAADRVIPLLGDRQR
jgi:pyruvate, water dikinase